MARNTSISLGFRFDEFIAGPITSGCHGAASEVDRAALRLLDTNKRKLEVPRRALAAGERSGRATYSHESLIAELDAESDAR